MRRGLLAIAACLALAGCLVLAACGGGGQLDAPGEDRPPGAAGRPDGVEVPGLVVAPSQRSVAATLDRLERELDREGPPALVATVDHAAQAERAGLRLPPTSLAVFGDPRLGTPLMQRNQLVALDLPKDFLVWRADDGRTRLAYNSARYLSERYGLAGARELSPINDDLRRLAAVASDTPTGVAGAPVSGIGLEEGIERVQSDAGVPETVSRLERLLESRRRLAVAYRIDHARNARRAGLELRPTVLVGLANPAVGTRLMRSARTIGIDLPQKLLVYEDASGRTFVAYNDPRYLATRHGVQGRDELVARTATALEGLARSAAGASGG